MKFLHTADWQLGKPFAGIDDEEKRSLVRQERFAVVDRIGAVAREHGAAFVVVAGDLFDSPSATKQTVAAACAAIGRLGLPVYVIPGNHDHGGPGSVWEQEFFQREREQLAPNLRVLLTPEPVELEEAVLLPCPLLRRQEAADATAWLRPREVAERFAGKARIVLAHGSTQSFGAELDDDPDAGGTANLVDLARLPSDVYDYIALGDWHGAKQVDARAWFSGTPEPDRFPKAGDYLPGQVLVVELAHGRPPAVRPVSTSRLEWHGVNFTFTDDASLGILERQIDERVGQRVNQDLLRLELSGTLGIEATTRLQQRIESWRARLLRLKLADRTIIAPSPEELSALTQRAADPLISAVAAKLVVQATGDDERGAVARVALRELHALCRAK